MDREVARRLLGVPPGASRAQLEAAFRSQAGRTHPDRGGDARQFHQIVEARDLLLAPPLAPSGARVVAVPSVGIWRQVARVVMQRLAGRPQDRRRRVV